MEKSQVQPATGQSIAGLVLGISSVVLFWVPIVHLVLAVLAIIFGSIALSKKQRFGLSGLLTGALSYVPVLILWSWAVYVASVASTI